jgi:hypothetical protein
MGQIAVVKGRLFALGETDETKAPEKLAEHCTMAAPCNSLPFET